MKQGFWQKPSFTFRALLFLVLFFILTSGAHIFLFKETSASPSVELGFSSLSPAGREAGEIVPASCESGFTHDNGADCDFFNFSVDQPSVADGQSTILRWSINPGYWLELPFRYVQSCDASGDWSGNKNQFGLQDPSHQASQSTGPLSGPRMYTYHLTCTEFFLYQGFVSLTKTVTVDAGPPDDGNRPPDAPVITGPVTGTPGSHTFAMRGTDPDNDQIRYVIDWGADDTIDGYQPANGYAPSGNTQTGIRDLQTLGPFTFRVHTQDEGGLNSPSATHTITIVPGGSAPNPPTINGSTNGSATAYPGNYTFNIQGTDDDGDQVRYDIDSDGNGNFENYLPSGGYVASGAVQSTSRTFTTIGNYSFRAVTEDVNGNRSGVSTHTVNVIYPPCPCDRDSQVCSGQSYSTSGPQCSTNTSCQGRRACDFYWQEVSP